jgi:glutamine synthetase
MSDSEVHGAARLEVLRKQMRGGEVDTLMVAFTDMQGRLMGKRASAAAFLDGLVDHGAHFCTYLLGTDMEMNTPEGFRLTSWATGYGDWMASPDWDTLRVLPWQDRTALVLCDVIVEATHEEVPVSPRTILKRQLARAAEQGLAIKAGSEFEYYLLTDTYEDAHRKGFRDLETFGHYNEDYHLLQATKGEPVHGKLRRLMAEARVPVDFSKGEAAPGQHEVNIRYDGALESADRSVIFKHGAKEIAWLEGYGLTFMAKPDHGWTGSSGHIHLSAWDAETGQARFHPGDDADPEALSDLGRWFLGGMMALARELAVFYAPNVNSYKRYAVASWAPVNVAWGRDNRTTGFRVVGRGPSLHVECRFPGGDMNAYLAYAALIGAGLHGIAERIEPPPETVGNAYAATDRQRLPRALHEAIRELEASSAARSILGQDVVEHYLNAARVEQATYDAVVHPWDRERYLERS